MRKTSLLIIFLFLLTIPVSAEVFLSPDEWEFSVTAGNSYTEEINVVRFEGNETEIGFEFEVERDGEDISEGVNISTDPETVILDTGETKEVEVTVDTNYRLSPGEIVVQMNSGPIHEEDVPEEEETDQTDDSDEESGGQPPPNQGEDGDTGSEDGGDSKNQTDRDSEENDKDESEPEEETENLVDDIEEVYEQEGSESEKFVPINIAVSFTLGIMVLLLGIL